MKRIRSISFVAAAVMMLALTGCCGGGSSTTSIEKPTYTTTVGQQMLDLQKAYESGAMTESEYKKAKEDLLNRIEK